MKAEDILDRLGKQYPSVCFPGGCKEFHLHVNLCSNKQYATFQVGVAW